MNTTCFRVATALAFVVILSFPSPPARAVTIIGEYIGPGEPFDPAGAVGFGEAAPPTVFGLGSLETAFDAAADIWEQAIADDHTITIQYGWGALDSIGEAFSIGDTVSPPIYGSILFDNDTSSTFFADESPLLNDEWMPPTESTLSLGGGPVNVARVFEPLIGASTDVTDNKDLVTVALHEIGHILGVNSLPPGFTPITPPRPFDGTVIPTIDDDDTLPGDTPHFDAGTVPGALMTPTLSDGLRKMPSAIDILAVAQQRDWTEVDPDLTLDPSYTSGPGEAIEGLGLAGDSSTWAVVDVKDLGFAHHGLPTLSISEEALDTEPFDIEIAVELSAPEAEVIVAIDKFVKNMTGDDFIGFELLLGTGMGDTFEPSTLGDGLEFLLTPTPSEEAGNFGAVTFLDDSIEPNFLAWTDGIQFAGGDEAAYWLAMSVSDAIGGAPDDGMAVFTLRQIPITAPVPEPVAGWPLCLFSTWLFTRRRSKN